jgi:hypothetical protein
MQRLDVNLLRFRASPRPSAAQPVIGGPAIAGRPELVAARRGLGRVVAGSGLTSGPVAHLRSRVERYEDLPLAPGITEVDPKYRIIDDARVASARNEFLTLAQAKGIANPEALFDKIVSTARIIDERSFTLALIQMRNALQQFLKDEPFILVRAQDGRSEHYVFERLKQLGLDRLPLRVVAWSEYGQRMHHYLGREQKQGIKCVVLDDAAYSGETIKRSLHALKDAGVDADKIFVGLAGASRGGFNTIDWFAKHRYVGVAMPAWSEGFDAADIEALSKMYAIPRSDLDGHVASPGMRSFTTTWFHVADNVSKLLKFTGLYRGKPFLFERREGLLSGYDGMLNVAQTEPQDIDFMDRQEVLRAARFVLGPIAARHLSFQLAGYRISKTRSSYMIEIPSKDGGEFSVYFENENESGVVVYLPDGTGYRQIFGDEVEDDDDFDNEIETTTTVDFNWRDRG